MQLDSLTRTPRMYYDNPFRFMHNPQKYGIEPQKLKKILEANPNLKGWHIYYSRIAHINAKRRDSALFYANKALEAYRSLPNKKGRHWDQQMLMHFFISEALRSLDRDQNGSIQNMQEALKFAQRDTLKNWIGICYSAIARNHFDMGNDSIALQYYLKSSQDSLHMSNPRAYIVIHSVMGSIYSNLGKNKLAKKHTRLAITASENNDYKANFFPLYTVLADIYLREKKEDSLRYSYRKAIESYELYNNEPSQGTEEMVYFYKTYKAFFKLEEGALDEVIEYTTDAVKNGTSREKTNIFEKKMVLMAAKLLSEAYERKGNSKKHTELLTTISAYLDKFHTQKLEEGLENLEIQYQTKEKDNSIAQLEESKRQQDAIISQQKIITYGIGGLFLLGFAIGVLFWRQRKLKNLYEKESLEQQLLRAQMNPHFTFNTLSQIQNLIDKNPKEAKNYLIKFSRLLVSIFESSTSNYVSLRKELNSLEEYIELQRIHFPEVFEFSIKLNDIDAETVFVPGMLIQPVVENSIKHGFSGIDYPGKISLELKREGSYISCSIEDNGRGLSTSHLVNGQFSSTHLISNFLDKVTKRAYTILNKKDTFENQTGVIVNFSIPYKLSPND